jgi:hypothetical protein
MSLFAEVSQKISEHEEAERTRAREREFKRTLDHAKRMAALDETAKACADGFIAEIKKNALRRKAGGACASADEGDTLDRQYAEAVRQRTHHFLRLAFGEDADKFYVKNYEVFHEAGRDSDAAMSWPASTWFCISIEW